MSTKKKDKETAPEILDLEDARQLIAQYQNDIERLKKENRELEDRKHYVELEVAVLEKAAEILKKDQGINLKELTNKEKTLVIDALRKKYKLKDLLPVLRISKSSYCYQANALLNDKYAYIRTEMHKIFNDNNACYGYRRIHCCLGRSGIHISEKVVRRLMKEECIQVVCKRRRKYSSYKGEISPAVPNLLNRDFHASRPNEKWLTDITEFGLPNSKVYLSPIIDCFDGLVVSWAIGLSPNANLVNTMLMNGISVLEEGQKPIIHSDRGCHYQWPQWIETMKDAGLTRSMSKKGCSPDNSACEGFFGRLKNEMFYGRKWQGVSSEQFINEVDKYIHWYNEKRIKLSLGGLSPIEYREAFLNNEAKKVQ